MATQTETALGTAPPTETLRQTREVPKITFPPIVTVVMRAVREAPSPLPVPHLWRRSSDRLSRNRRGQRVPLTTTVVNTDLPALGQRASAVIQPNDHRRMVSVTNQQGVIFP